MSVDSDDVGIWVVDLPADDVAGGWRVAVGDGGWAGYGDDTTPTPSSTGWAA